MLFDKITKEALSIHPQSAILLLMDILKGKKALVTGSSRGIGLKITQVFLSEGAEVWGMCTHESKAKAETEALAGEHGTAYHEFYADASDADALKSGV